MGDLSGREFGLIIAYVLPGMVCLLGAAAYSETVNAWVLVESSGGPSLGGFLYALVASIGSGMLAGAVRWALLDRLFLLCGVRRPAWDDGRLGERLDAFNYLVENHYRYFQFYGNTLVCLPVAYATHRFSVTPPPLAGWWSDLSVLFLCIVLFAAARDALANYYSRAAVLLGTVAERTSVMTNGNHVAESGGSVNSKASPKQTATNTTAPSVKEAAKPPRPADEK